ncbi:hypothetical protein C8R44DRAFT_328218 [Mycena epipterygia]|nr:hypothetical protein C8R44DRAFT_117580 [Mycena epipterygia]KAJ7105821.1 hypothetical protein C8R44DRAFT_328218 [Mycena epipterygia]
MGHRATSQSTPRRPTRKARLTGSWRRTSGPRYSRRMRSSFVDIQAPRSSRGRRETKWRELRQACDCGFRQLWGQMHQYEVNFVKLFSPAGVVYVRRDHLLSKTLVLSKTYRSLDGDVARTVCIVLEAREKAEHISTLTLRAVVRCEDWISQWLLSFIWLLQLLWISWYRQIRGVYILIGQRDAFFRDVSEQFDLSRCAP